MKATADITAKTEDQPFVILRGVGLEHMLVLDLFSLPVSFSLPVEAGGGKDWVLDNLGCFEWSSVK